MRAHLPLLSKKQYYSTVKYGYAKGNEPVIYVDNIQYYTHYLQLHSLSQQNGNNPTSEPTLKEEWKTKGPVSL